MTTIAITGSGSGIGAATRDLLESNSIKTIGIDLQNAEIQADLGTSEGREEAITSVLELSQGKLDGLVTCAGVSVPFDPKLMLSINWFGTVELLEGLRDALTKSSKSSYVVAVSSNSTTITPNIPEELVTLCLDRDELGAHNLLDSLSGAEAMAISYAASKLAIARYVRLNAPQNQWAASGIRLNGICPGAVMTPLLESSLLDPNFGPAVKQLPLPVGGFGSPSLIAEWIAMMLSPSADFMCGSLVFVDGGSDALIRPNDWPKSLSI